MERTRLSCAQVSDSLPAFALGIGDVHEWDAVASHLAGCQRCTRVLAGDRLTVERMERSAMVATPPSGLRERLLREIGAQSSGTSQTVRRVNQRLRWDLAAAVLAAVLAVSALGGWLAIRPLMEARDEARQDLAYAERQQAVVAEYLSAGGAAYPLVPASSELVASQGAVVTSGDGSSGCVMVSNWQPLEDGQHYRVWVARAGERTRLADLEVREDGSGWLWFESPEPLGTYDTLGVTLVDDASDTRTDLSIVTLAGG